VKESDIRKLVFGEVNNALSGESVAWPNTHFDPPSGLYYRVNILSGETQSIGIAEVNRKVGVIQIDVIAPAGEGEIKVMDKVDEIIQAFKRGSKLRDMGREIRIDQQPWAGAPNQSRDRYAVPVSIPYEIYF